MSWCFNTSFFSSVRKRQVSSILGYFLTDEISYLAYVPLIPRAILVRTKHKLPREVFKVQKGEKLHRINNLSAVNPSNPSIWFTQYRNKFIENRIIENLVVKKTCFFFLQKSAFNFEGRVAVFIAVHMLQKWAGLILLCRTRYPCAACILMRFKIYTEFSLLDFQSFWSCITDQSSFKNRENEKERGNPISNAFIAPMLIR